MLRRGLPLLRHLLVIPSCPCDGDAAPWTDQPSIEWGRSLCRGGKIHDDGHAWGANAAVLQ